ncbi:MAG: ATP-binding cassette domain-containing protein [Chloroflexi bacterium]|nr:ATP-binding cassette domain-containing protein [Chloroflexota bacterium]
MSLVRLRAVTKRYDTTVVMRNVFFTLNRGDRVGIIGKNGAGKTTLLKLILGQEEPNDGTVEIDNGIRIGYFSQFSELNGEMSVLDVLEQTFADIRAVEAELGRIEAALESSPESNELSRLLNRQMALFDFMEQREGWTISNRIDTVLSRLGFNDAYRVRPIDQLSGGWRNRAALAKILLEEPDVLLMDEPTNYLDIDGVAWLEQWFNKLRGALIVVSHDRSFLDNVVNRIIEVENRSLQEYPGDFTQYVREKRLRLKSLERQFEHEEELLVYEAEAIADRLAATKNPSEALRRRLANVKKKVEPKPVDRIVTSIYDRLQVSVNLFAAERLSKTYGDQVIFHDLSFEIHRGERIAIVGPNGCGKTTLLRVLVGLEEPDSGVFVQGKRAEYCYYNQVFDELDLNDTVSHAVNVFGLGYLAPRKQVNRLLALLQFSEMDLNQQIGTLSGGQRARVALAKCLLSGAALLFLDEPTNHLDMTSTQVMERALMHFPGAVVVASHDRFFIDKIATHLLIFEGHGHVRQVSGNWTIWLASKTNAPSTG